MTAIPEYSSPNPGGIVGLYRRVIKLPERIPFSLVQLAARLAISHVFWQSAQTKLASWPVTLQLFPPMRVAASRLAHTHLWQRLPKRLRRAGSSWGYSPALAH